LKNAIFADFIQPLVKNCNLFDRFQSVVWSEDLCRFVIERGYQNDKERSDVVLAHKFLANIDQPRPQEYDDERIELSKIQFKDKSYPPKLTKALQDNLYRSYEERLKQYIPEPIIWYEQFCPKHLHSRIIVVESRSIIGIDRSSDHKLEFPVGVPNPITRLTISEDTELLKLFREKLRTVDRLRAWTRTATWTRRGSIRLRYRTPTILEESGGLPTKDPKARFAYDGEFNRLVAFQDSERRWYFEHCHKKPNVAEPQSSGAVRTEAIYQKIIAKWDSAPEIERRRVMELALHCAITQIDSTLGMSICMQNVHRALACNAVVKFLGGIDQEFKIMAVAQRALAQDMKRTDNRPIVAGATRAWLDPAIIPPTLTTSLGKSVELDAEAAEELRDYPGTGTAILLTEAQIAEGLES
jgi:hypothetical protein